MEEIILINEVTSTSFNNKNSKGLFISFEGGEGSGKSTQIRLLSNDLSKNNLPFVLTREPGGTPVGEEIRKTLVSGKVEKLDSYSELLCFVAARRQHLKDLIIPSLNEGKIVICDRFVDSTIVYQGYAGGVSLDKIKLLHEEYCFGIYPDLTILLDIDPEKGLKRKTFSNLNEDRFENQQIDFHYNIRKKYLELTEIYKNRFIKIDGSLNKIEIFEIIKSQIMNFFKKI